MLETTTIANFVANLFGLAAGGMAGIAVLFTLRKYFRAKRPDHEATRNTTLGTVSAFSQAVERDPQVVIVPDTGTIEIETTGNESPVLTISIERSKTAKKQLKVAHG